MAMMKDQVDALQASGVPATFLNSSLAAGESRARLRGSVKMASKPGRTTPG